MEFDVMFSQEPRIIEVEMSEAPDTFDAGIEVDNTVAVGNSDHRNLTFRDADDQHPISAITKLKAMLDTKPDETLNNEDIESIIGGYTDPSGGEGGGDEPEIVVDTLLSASSPNPVQNKAIYAALAQKEKTGVAASLVSAHDSDSNAHADIRAAVAGKESAGTAKAAVAAHNNDASAHSDIRAAIAEKISQSDLQSGIDTALAQAKASGEFDGKDGVDGKDGAQGIQGEKGENGKDGEKGADGKTPVKGTDYWTDADKSEIVEDTKNAIDLSSYAEKTELENYLPLTGGTCTGGVAAPNFQTGSSVGAYFQTKKMRGEGNADTYYHAVDWGFAGHDRVDFHEYGGIWNFYRNTSGKYNTGVLCGSIRPTGWNGGAVLTGTPTAPTAAAETNTTQIATTEFVQAAIKKALKDAGLITE